MLYAYLLTGAQETVEVQRGRPPAQGMSITQHARYQSLSLSPRRMSPAGLSRDTTTITEHVDVADVIVTVPEGGITQHHVIWFERVADGTHLLNHPQNCPLQL